jgi:CDP-glycerol glycerophosphotransferase (TagB/SpsB family)
LRDYARVLAGNLVLHPLSNLFSRDPRLWAFGAPDGRFEGNSKYVFLWMASSSWPAKAIWITRNPQLARRLKQHGLASAYRWSLEGMRAAARAGIYVVNESTSDINFGLSGGARIFNLWHGVGLKNVRHGAHVGYGAELQARSRNPVSKIRTMRRFEKPDWILSTSPEMSEEFFARCFDLPAERAPPLGYPRLDPVLDAELKRLALSFDDYSPVLKRDGKKHILYAPTLRDKAKSIFANALPDLERLSTALQKQDAVLFLKLHPKMRVDVADPQPIPANIRILHPYVDIHPVLHDFDAIITDYSSLFFDYIFARSNGVVLYPYDFHQYTAEERDLAWNYDAATVGVRVNDFGALCDVIDDGRVFAKLEPVKLDSLRKRFWGGEHPGSVASQGVVEFLLGNTAAGVKSRPNDLAPLQNRC